MLKARFVFVFSMHFRAATLRDLTEQATRVRQTAQANARAPLTKAGAKKSAPPPSAPAASRAAPGAALAAAKPSPSEALSSLAAPPAPALRASESCPSPNPDRAPARAGLAGRRDRPRPPSGEAGGLDPDPAPRAASSIAPAPPVNSGSAAPIAGLRRPSGLRPALGSARGNPPPRAFSDPACTGSTGVCMRRTGTGRTSQVRGGSQRRHGHRRVAPRAPPARRAAARLGRICSRTWRRGLLRRGLRLHVQQRAQRMRGAQLVGLGRVGRGGVHRVRVGVALMARQVGLLGQRSREPSLAQHHRVSARRRRAAARRCCRVRYVRVRLCARMRRAAARAGVLAHVTHSILLLLAGSGHVRIGPPRALVRGPARLLVCGRHSARHGRRPRARRAGGQAQRRRRRV